MACSLNSVHQQNQQRHWLRSLETNAKVNVITLSLYLLARVKYYLLLEARMSLGPGDMGSRQYWHRQSFPLKVTLSPAGNGRLEVEWHKTVGQIIRSDPVWSKSKSVWRGSFCFPAVVIYWNCNSCHLCLRASLYIKFMATVYNMQKVIHILKQNKAAVYSFWSPFDQM